MLNIIHHVKHVRKEGFQYQGFHEQMVVTENKSLYVKAVTKKEKKTCGYCENK